jgi:hypothetical protein
VNAIHSFIVDSGLQLFHLSVGSSIFVFLRISHSVISH